MAKKMPIAQFVNEVQAAIDRKDGYIMGAKGQDPKKWGKTSWFYTQYDGNGYSRAQKDKALYWREHAQRVWDCNGLAEGIYEDYTGVNINTKARFNYSDWCDPKGKGDIPVQYRVSGAAVFIHSSSAGYITHVGYLLRPVKADRPDDDWWVGEARGVMYGCVATKLSERNWNRWGWMTKYFDYGDDVPSTRLELGLRMLRNGYEGEDVQMLQTALIRLGYSCGSYGADGDFGDATEQAVMKFQKANGLSIDGIFGPNTLDALNKALAALDNNDTGSGKPKTVRIVGGNCWMRSEPHTGGKQLAVAHEGDTLTYEGETAENGWHKISGGNAGGWVSGKYSVLGR